MDLMANLLCSFVLLEKPWEEVRKHLDVSNFERATERINGAKSVLWTINHIGNWELFIFCAALVRPGKHAVLYRALPNRFIDAHIRRARGSTGLELIERKHGLAQSTSVLKAGGMLAILVDQHAGDKGIWTPFFNRLASTTPLPAILATKTGAELLPVAIFTVGPGKWRLEVSEFVPKRGASVEELTHRINRALESLIIRRPSDWFWLHQRWKTPSPKFLLREYKRGVYVPKNSGRLAPFRILVRSSNWLGDAVMSAPAVRRLKRGRPDVRLTVLTRAKLADFWRLVPEVDELITIEPGDSVFRVASKIRRRFRGGDSISEFCQKCHRSLVSRDTAPGRLLSAMARFFSESIHSGTAVSGSVATSERALPAHHGSNRGESGRSVGAARHHGPAEPGLAGLCPGAEYGPAKRWTEFGSAAQQLSERHGLHWLIFGTANEKPLAAEIMKWLEDQRNRSDRSHFSTGTGAAASTVQTLADQRYWDDAFGSISGGADRGDFRFDRAATDGADGRRSRGDPPSRGVQSMFSPGMPSGFSMYESGDGGRSSARGREGDGGDGSGVGVVGSVGV